MTAPLPHRSVVGSNGAETKLRYLMYFQRTAEGSPRNRYERKLGGHCPETLSSRGKYHTWKSVMTKW